MDDEVCAFVDKPVLELRLTEELADAYMGMAGGVRTRTVEVLGRLGMSR